MSPGLEYIGWKTALGANATTYAVEFANYFFAKLQDKVPVSTAKSDAFNLLKKQYGFEVGTGETQYPSWLDGLNGEGGYTRSLTILGNSGLSFEKKEK